MAIASVRATLPMGPLPEEEGLRVRTCPLAQRRAGGKSSGHRRGAAARRAQATSPPLRLNAQVVGERLSALHRRVRSNESEVADAPDFPGINTPRRGAPARLVGAPDEQIAHLRSFVASNAQGSWEKLAGATTGTTTSSARPRQARNTPRTWPTCRATSTARCRRPRQAGRGGRTPRRLGGFPPPPIHGSARDFTLTWGP